MSFSESAETLWSILSVRGGTRTRHTRSPLVTSSSPGMECHLHYVPGEPMATHVINFMHLVLPEGERAMSATLAEALPLIEDERLHEEVVGFVGQEATHAASTRCSWNTSRNWAWTSNRWRRRWTGS